MNPVTSTRQSCCLRWTLCSLVCATLVLGCATPADQVQQHLRAGQVAHALALAQAAALRDPADEATRLALLRARQARAGELVSQAEHARQQGLLDDADAALAQLLELEPRHPRLTTLRREVDRARQHLRTLAEARSALQRPAREREAARAALRSMLTELPGHAGARSLLAQLGEPAAPLSPALPLAMAAAYQKPVTLEFRDAPLRSVFEALSRSAGVNFVFDKDVRSEVKLSLHLRDVTLDEAVRVVMASQQLERKLLNESTVLVYPNTQAKQREHQDLVTRSFYLANADAKQAQALVRTMAKTRDLHIDERLNLLVVRDTPQVVALIEHLLAGIDMPEPEVLLDVQVMEVASNRLDELGLGWPASVGYGLVNADRSMPATALLGERRNFVASVANPALVAVLNGNTGHTNLLANPSIRARNREKARVQVGEKLPVFTTTAIANVQGVSTTVTYVDVGLKLEVEPSVQLDNEVVMKINLEVTNLLATVPGPSDSVAYEVGTRSASTSLRLKDGETQVLAGLIRDEDRRSAEGLPVLSSLPVLGRLFGVQSDRRDKREVVLLITPRVLRNLLPPGAEQAQRSAGTDASPGNEALRLRPQARAALASSRQPPAVGTAAAASGATPAVGFAEPALEASTGLALRLEASSEASPGGTVAVTLRHDGLATVNGELQYDPTRFTLGSDSSGRVAFELPPRGQQALVLRVRADAPAGATSLSLGGVTARVEGGAAPAVRVEGTGQVLIKASP